MHRKISSILLVVSLFGAPAFAEESALITVTSTPASAAVSLDDKPVGQTPLVGLSVAAGRHRLRLVVSDPSNAPSAFEQELDASAVQPLVINHDFNLLSQPVPPAGVSLVPVKVPDAAVVKRPWLNIPWETWLAGGTAAALFGVGLGFGISASDIEHRAGVTYSSSGVDLGLTRATALAGQQDAQFATGLLVTAGVVTLVGLAFAAFAPETPDSAPVKGTPP